MRKLSFNVFKRFGRSNPQTKLEETPQSDLSHSTPNLLGSISSSRQVARRRLHKRLTGATGTDDDFSYTAVSPLRHFDNASSVGSDYIGMHPSRSTPMITEMRRDSESPSGRLVDEFSEYEPGNQDTTYEFVERPSPFSRPPAFQHDDYVRDQSSFSGSSGSTRSTPNYSSSILPPPIERRRSSRSSGQSSNGHVGVSYTPTSIPPASLNDRHTLPRSSRRNSSRPRSSRSSNDAQSVAIPPHGQQSEGQVVGPSTYYIVPGGLRAIFTDQNGNEITR
ncbi:hypothetical protein BDZ89DRAFT_8814 [Hymenopellis radicata]|nr:hypothetical protein BDZ89DRAFT_8814 [Hymenopellis radicata]